MIQFHWLAVFFRWLETTAFTSLDLFFSVILCTDSTKFNGHFAPTIGESMFFWDFCQASNLQANIQDILWSPLTLGVIKIPKKPPTPPFRRCFIPCQSLTSSLPLKSDPKPNRKGLSSKPPCFQGLLLLKLQGGLNWWFFCCQCRNVDTSGNFATPSDASVKQDAIRSFF